MKRIAFIIGCLLLISQPYLHTQEIKKQLSDTANIKLNEVVIKGHKLYNKLKDGKWIIQIEKSPLAKVGTLNDVLKQLPRFIEKNGELIIFGKGHPLFYINEREVKNNTELDNLKSEEIKSIELTTATGADVNSEALCIVKINTIKQTMEGWDIGVRSSYYQCHHANWIEEINLNYHHKQIDFFSTLKYNKNVFTRHSRIEQNVYVDTLWRQQNSQTFSTEEKCYQIISGFDQTVKQHSFGIQCTLNLSSYLKSNSVLNSIVWANDKYYDKWNNNNNDISDIKPSHLLNAYYNISCKNWKLIMNTDWLWNESKKKSSASELSETRDDRMIFSLNRIKNEMFAINMLFSKTLFNGKIKIGNQYIHTRRNDDYQCQQSYIDSSLSLLKEHNISPFIEYEKILPIGLLTSGLRYEYIRFNYYQNTINTMNKNYSNLFPSVQFSTKIRNLQLMMNYCIKTKRPTYKQLSNNQFYGNRYTIQTGNPLLRQEIIPTLSLQGAWKRCQFSIDYQNEKNAIIYCAEQLEKEPAISIVSYRNLKNLRSLTAFCVTNPVYKIWSGTLSIGIQKQWLHVTSCNKKISLNNPMWILSFNNNLKLSKEFLFMINMNYQTRGDYQNIQLIDSQSAINIALQKSFYHDKLSVILRGTDIFNGTRDSNILYNDKMHLFIMNRYNSRKFEITVYYHFNATKNKYKGTTVNEEEIKRL